MNFNHLSKNLITKGWLDTSIITKGFILPVFKYIIYTRRRPTGSGGYGIEKMYKDIGKLKSEGIDYIEVFVEWNKVNTTHDKKIYAELIKKKIEVELLDKFNEKIKIDVDII